MAIYRGLNVAKALNDVDDSATALINLGLNKLDLKLVSGLTAAENDVNIREFHTVAGLVVDQKKSLYSLGRSSEAMAAELNALADIKQPLAYNYRLNSQLQAGAIKYGYFDFATNTQKQADISTSRVSSWSTIGSTISYGGEVKVVGTEFSFLTLGTTVAPLAKAFRSEVPTHVIKLQVDGVEQDFLAMKGIPLVFDTFFRNADLSAAVNPISDGSGVIPITWRITNEDDGQSYNSGDGSGTSGNIGTGTELSPVVYSFRDSSSKARTLEFFYNPANVVRLSLNGLNLSTWTTVSLPALKRLDISSNDFYQLPSFRSDVSAKTALTPEELAPALTHMTINNNNMSRAIDASGVQITANAQLNTLPTTLQSLEMNGVFSDSTTIDLLDYTSLTNFYMHSYYDQYGSRSMTGGTVMPKVATSIQSYQIYNQPFSQMCNGLINSTNLTYLWFPFCGTSEKEGGGEITILSTVIQQFLSYGNGHNVVNMSGKSSLVNYTQEYSSPSGNSTFVGKFTGCTGLTELNFYGSGVTGSIQAGLQDLPSLLTFEGRYSGISGELRDTSFQGTNKLVTLLLAASSHTGTDFFGTAASSRGGTVFYNTPDLQNLYAYSNKNIRGQMPNMSKSIKLRVVYLHNTGLSGPLPSFSGCDSLYYIEMNYTRDGTDQGFTGTIPTYSLPGLNYLSLTYNRLTGQCPAFQCPFLYQLSIDSNELVGSIPNLSGCSRLQKIIMNSNQMDSYVEGNLRSNIFASVIDISNNKLPASVGPTLISDLLKNWASNPRSGVTVNLLGNNGLTETNTRNDGTDPTSENSTASKLDSLRQKGWTILMD
jgi:hypothetical protein